MKMTKTRLALLSGGAAAALLFAVVAGGSFRRWEQLMFVLIASNVALIPIVLSVHPTIGGSVG